MRPFCYERDLPVEGFSANGEQWVNWLSQARGPLQKLVEVVPGRKVVWLILDAWLSFTEDKSEWNGTRVIFEVSKHGDETEVCFTHEGLVPQYECFDKCSNAWGFYINSSLRDLITTGKGNPNPNEHSAAGQQ